MVILYRLNKFHIRLFRRLVGCNKISDSVAGPHTVSKIARHCSAAIHDEVP